MNKFFVERKLLSIATFFIRVFEIGFFSNILKIIPVVRLVLTNTSRLCGYITKDLLYPTLIFLATNSLLKLECLADIICSDYIELQERFLVVYSLLSHLFSFRFELITFSQDLDWLSSICSVYFNANWSEREIWDMFGLGFLNHPDLRRILTDYGFKGHPLRKEFPVLGFLEVSYSNVLNFIEYAPVTVSLLPRHFSMSNDNILSYA